MRPERCKGISPPPLTNKQKKGISSAAAVAVAAQIPVGLHSKRLHYFRLQTVPRVGLQFSCHFSSTLPASLPHQLFSFFDFTSDSFHFSPPTPLSRSPGLLSFPPSHFLLSFDCAAALLRLGCHVNTISEARE